MAIIWSAALETGHRQIDLQHQELVVLINELTDALEAGREFEALDDVLPRLSSYVLFHFGTEEMLMPGLPAGNTHAAAHCQAHRNFTDRVKALQESAAAGEKLEVGPLADFLKNWLTNHIMNTDRELVALLAHQSPTPR
ncbi:MAG: bacteriohemerythrin [Azonexus sp.]|jgi:hemerythrin-like metal-binding protein|nr:bacteriohemerythrin [Azonexus sp.]